MCFYDSRQKASRFCFDGAILNIFDCHFIFFTMFLKTLPLQLAFESDLRPKASRFCTERRFKAEGFELLHRALGGVLRPGISKFCNFVVLAAQAHGGALWPGISFKFRPSETALWIRKTPIPFSLRIQINFAIP